jgi:hypothetical protein
MHRAFGEGSVCDAATVYGREHDITVIDDGCPLMFDNSTTRCGFTGETARHNWFSCHFRGSKAARGRGDRRGGRTAAVSKLHPTNAATTPTGAALRPGHEGRTASNAHRHMVLPMVPVSPARTRPASAHPRDWSIRVVDQRQT